MWQNIFLILLFVNLKNSNSNFVSIVVTPLVNRLVTSVDAMR